MRAKWIFLLAAACFLAAVFFPFWKLTLLAPQYPDHLRVSVGVFGLSGDVHEVDGLNHYIGMRKLEEAAPIEMAIAPWGMAAFFLISVAAVLTRKKWVDWALLVPIAFPLVFLADVSFWLWYFGNNLDPHAPLNRSVGPFTPVVLFWSHVGQFSAYAMVQAGFVICAAGSVLALAGLLLRRRQAETRGPIRVRAGVTATAGVLLATAILLGGAGSAGAFGLQEAIDRAPPGATVRIPPGTYRGNFVVTQPLTLEPGGPPGSVLLDGGGRGQILRVLAPDVTVRGLRFQATGSSGDLEDAAITVLAPRARIEHNDIQDAFFGIYLRRASGSLIRGNRVVGKALPLMRRGDGIKVWSSPDTRLEDNVIEDSRDFVLWYSNRVTVRRNIVRNSRYGIHFMYSMDNVIEWNQLLDNHVGSYLMYSKNLVLRNNLFARNRGPSGYGVGLKEIDGLEMTGNRFVANRAGLYIDDSPSVVDRIHDVHDNLFAYNDIGIAFLPNVQRNVYHRNSFIDNGQQVSVLGGGDFQGNAFTEDGRGNYWSDYVGWDAAGDGVGDVPYRMESLFDAWMERDPRLRLFRGGLAAWLIDFAARMFPAFRPPVRVVDTGPLTSPPRAPVGPRPPPPRSAAPVIAACLALAGAALLLARPLRLGTS